MPFPEQGEHVQADHFGEEGVGDTVDQVDSAHCEVLGHKVRNSCGVDLEEQLKNRVINFGRVADYSFCDLVGIRHRLFGFGLIRVLLAEEFEHNR